MGEEKVEKIDEIELAAKHYEEKIPLEDIIEKNPWLKMDDIELKTLKLYFSLNLFEEKLENEKLSCKYVGLCRSRGNFLEDAVSFEMDIDKFDIMYKWTLNQNDLSKCNIGCGFKRCILKLMANIVYAVDKYNEINKTKLKCIDIIEYELAVNNNFSNKLEKDIFSKFNLTDLFFVRVIIKSRLVKIIENKEQIKFEYINLMECSIEDLYVKKIYDFFANRKCEKGIINAEDFKPQVSDLRFYEIAAYILAYGEAENINILNELEKYIFDKNNALRVTNRGKFFVYKRINEVNNLHYSDLAKQKIFELFNYVNNWYLDNNVPKLPINIIIYTSDTIVIQQITSIILKYMWYFGYFKEERRYNRSMNDIAIDKSLAKKIYETVDRDGKNIRIETGLVIIDDFTNIRFIDENNRNIIFNVITDKLKRTGNNVATVIYGDKEELDSILIKYPKWNEFLFNVKLDIENFSYKDINEIMCERLSDICVLSDDVKEKLHKYIKYSYNMSEVQNLEYTNKLYNQIIFNKYRKFDLNKLNTPLANEDIPSVEKMRDLEKILEELNSLVGLNIIKEQVSKLIDLLKFAKKTDFNTANLNLHMVFSGNPGVGKTTVARLISDILYNLGYVRLNKLIEVSAKELIAEYVGQTAIKTYNVMRSAFGGVLFIDEAYSIMDVDKFSYDCISTIVKIMEDYKDDLIIIFAGYDEEMERFIDANPGLKSRINNLIKFPDYRLDELFEIFENLCKKDNFRLTDKAEEIIKNVIEESSKSKNFGNARFINNLYQNILQLHASNTCDTSNLDELMIITENDVNYEEFIISDKNKARIGFI